MSHDPDEAVVLALVPSELEALLIVDALTERGVPAEATGALTAGFRAEAPGQVGVLVHRSDLEKAGQILEEVRQERSEIDWSTVDLGIAENPNGDEGS